MGRFFEEEPDENVKPVKMGQQPNIVGQCPDCGTLLVYQGGCYMCSSCGYSKC